MDSTEPGTIEFMIKCTREISAPIEELFNLTQDYALRMHWDPFPESYTFLNGNLVKEGLQLEVVDKAGRAMTVEYVSFKPPIVAAVKMIKGPWYINKFAGSWSFKAVGKTRTNVVFTYNIIGYPLFVSVIIAFVFKWHVNKRLDALKKYAESKIKPDHRASEF